MQRPLCNTRTTKTNFKIMNNYELARAVSKIWAETKTKKEIENELYQLLIILPYNDLKEIYYTQTK